MLTFPDGATEKYCGLVASIPIRIAPLIILSRASPVKKGKQKEVLERIAGKLDSRALTLLANE